MERPLLSFSRSWQEEAAFCHSLTDWCEWHWNAPSCSAWNTVALILKDKQNKVFCFFFFKVNGLERNWPKPPPKKEWRASSFWMAARNGPINQSGGLHTPAYYSYQWDFTNLLWCKVVTQNHISIKLFCSSEAQVNWGQASCTNRQALRRTLGLSERAFLFLLLCSRLPSAALAVISAPLTLRLGYLPGLLLFSSVGATQLSKRPFLVYPSQHWKKKNTEILACEAKEPPIGMRNSFF